MSEIDDFERDARRDIAFLTGLALADPHNAFTQHVSEYARLVLGFNDDASFQETRSDCFRQYFITELGSLQEGHREVLPQIVIVRDIALDLSRELGWQIGIFEDFHLGTMTMAEQAEYFVELPIHLTPIEPEELDEALLTIAEVADDAWVY